MYRLSYRRKSKASFYDCNRWIHPELSEKKNCCRGKCRIQSVWITMDKKMNINLSKNGINFNAPHSRTSVSSKYAVMITFYGNRFKCNIVILCWTFWPLLSATLWKAALQSRPSTRPTSLSHNAFPIPLHHSSQAHHFTPARSIPTAFRWQMRGLVTGTLY